MKTTTTLDAAFVALERQSLAAAYHARKRAACIRLARECSRSSWQYPEDRAEFLRLKREAMTDARAWSVKP
mgnify:CR=1 FL=1